MPDMMTGNRSTAFGIFLQNSRRQLPYLRRSDLQNISSEPGFEEENHVGTSKKKVEVLSIFV